MVHLCELCKKDAINRCSKCGTVYYCSKEHQKNHWKKHKSSCKPVEIKENDILGRHLVAKKDLVEGELLYKEKPLIHGPSQITIPVCLGCLKTITDEDSKPCDKCGWPVCNDHCQESPDHKAECELTVARGQKVHIQTFGIPHPNYQCITVLRCLYQKKSNPQIWNKLLELESHCEKRKGTEKWESDHIQIVQFIRRFFKLENEFTEEEIMKICGVVQVNGHEVPLTEPSYVAIYDTTSMIEHNCRANCTKSFSSTGEVLIAAAENIPKGANLSICYTDPLWGTANRRHHLKETKFFDCMCERCSDVTEGGTMLSAIKCTKGHCPGFMLPKTFIVKSLTEKNGGSENGNGKASNGKESNGKVKNGKDSNGNAANGNGKHHDDESPEIGDWYCNICDKTVTDHYVQKLIIHIGKDLNAMEKGSSDACLRFLGHYGKMLHENHFYMVDVALALAQLIGQEDDNGLAAVSDERLALKLEMSQKTLKVLDKLPAVNRVKGLLLFELHAVLAENGRRKTSRVAEGPFSLIDSLKESKSTLEKSIDLLKHEPTVLPEGKIRQQAEKNLENLVVLLRNLSVIADQKIM